MSASPSTSIRPPSPSTRRGPSTVGVRSSPPPCAGASPRPRSRGSCRSEAAPGPAPELTPVPPLAGAPFQEGSAPAVVAVDPILDGCGSRASPWNSSINSLDVDDGGYVARSRCAWRARGKRRRPPPASKGTRSRWRWGVTKFGSVALPAEVLRAPRAAVLLVGLHPRRRMKRTGTRSASHTFSFPS